MTPQESITIRDCAPAEYEVAGELVVEAYRTLGDSGDEFYEQELRDIAGRVATSDVLVAESDGQILGCVTLVDGLKPLSEVDDPDAATIRMLGVATEARGRGIGQALVRACIDRARNSGRKRVRLDTRTSMTSAHRLYERLGFRRDPDHDWSPAPGILLLGYVLDLETPPPAGESDWEGEGGASAPEPKQETPKDVKAPASKRRRIVQGFRRVVQPVRKT